MTEVFRKCRDLFPPPAITTVLLVVTLILTALLYWPGLSGLWLLDDNQNLKLLKKPAATELGQHLAQYLTIFLSGPSGRPLSLLSFALQHNDWPENPWPFKLVNLIIHLLNGGLLYVLLRQLGIAAGLGNQRGAWCALLTAALWLVHPLQVSTVLYIIQRMAELSALFTLAGLLAYVHGRRQLTEGKTGRGLAWMSIGVAAGGTLATLSKENGALLPLYIIMIEFTLLRELPRPRAWRVWAIPFLYLPILALVGYFLHVTQWIITQNGYPGRDFTPAERLLTQSRVLCDYLGKIFFPQPARLGLFHDDFVLSRSLLDPPETLPAVLVITGIVVAAFVFRKSAPVFAFGALWFIGGHLLESTIIPLEIYYEHRNYLPLLGPLFACVLYARSVLEIRYARYSKQLMIIMAACFFTLFAIITRAEALLWGDSYSQAQIWADEKPNSKRAQAHSASLMTLTGNYERAASIYKHIGERDPHDGDSFILWLELGCYNSKVRLPDMRDVITRLRSGKDYKAGIVTLDEIVRMRGGRACGRLKYEDLVLILDTMIKNPNYAGHLSNLYIISGNLHATAGMLNPAMDSLDKAFLHSGRVDVLLFQVETLASAGLYADALRYLDKAKIENKRYQIFLRHAYEAEIDAWDNTLRAISAEQKNIQTSPKTTVADQPK